MFVSGERGFSSIAPIRIDICVMNRTSTANSPIADFEDLPELVLGCIGEFFNVQYLKI
jgi:hypothetical protein